MRRQRTRDELIALYNEQWSFLRRSADEFDRGDTSEAKRLASTMRLLLHDTKNSHSLVAQIGLKEALFFDTATDILSANLASTFGLVQVRFVNGRADYVPRLDRMGETGIWMIPFEYWWTKPVIFVPGEFQLTRAELVLIMADQDGGAHVDPGVDERYYRLRSEAALNWSMVTEFGSEALLNLERASIRQIAHEVMTSLIVPRRVVPNDMPAEPSQWRTEIIKDARTGVTTNRQREIRPICPCKSGLPYLQCHAKGGLNEGKVVAPALPNVR